jgi:hypothetical protein
MGWTLPANQGGSILRLFFVHQAYDVKNPAGKMIFSGEL